MTTGILAGMRAEARCLPHDGAFRVAVTGGRAERARALATELAESDVAGLVSFGLAGGLDRRLTAGDLVVADAVLAPDGKRFATEPEWREAIVAAIKPLSLPFRVAPVAGVDGPVTTVAAKHALFEEAGAAAADMESHHAARAAFTRGLPLLVIRVVADTAEESVPASALVGLGPDGNFRPLAVLRALLGAPRELWPLLRLARAARRAESRLRRVGGLLEEPPAPADGRPG